MLCEDTHDVGHILRPQEIQQGCKADLSSQGYVFNLAATPKPEDFESANQRPGWRQATAKEHN